MRTHRVSKRRLVACALLAGLVLWAACDLRKAVPVRCQRRDSLVGQGPVVIVRNQANQALGLWIEAAEKKAHFTLQPRGHKEFGWLEGFHFGDNSSFTIGGEGYAPRAFDVADLERR